MTSVFNQWIYLFIFLFFFPSSISFSLFFLFFLFTFFFPFFQGGSSRCGPPPPRRRALGPGVDPALYARTAHGLFSLSIYHGGWLCVDRLRGYFSLPKSMGYKTMIELLNVYIKNDFQTEAPICNHHLPLTQSLFFGQRPPCGTSS